MWLERDFRRKNNTYLLGEMHEAYTSFNWCAINIFLPQKASCFFLGHIHFSVRGLIFSTYEGFIVDIKKYWWVVIVAIGLYFAWHRVDIGEWLYSVARYPGT